MKKFEVELLEQLNEIQETLEQTLRKEKDFRVTTIGAEGETYTYDRENYLQFGMEIASEQLQSVIEEIAERAEMKSKLNIVK